MNEDTSLLPAQRVERYDVTAPPRCPACYYLLEGLAESGACPECGKAYDPLSRFSHASINDFGRTFWNWMWPVVIGGGIELILVLAMAIGADEHAGACLSLMLCFSLLVCFINASVRSFESIRRRRLRNPLVTAFVPTFATHLASVGLGALVTLAASVVLFGVGCGLFFLTFSMPSVH